MIEMSSIPKPQNPLSFSPNGESYTGRGCFPLGHHVSHDDIAELTQTLNHLRETKMLRPISPATISTIRSELTPLREAQGFWSHARDAKQALAIRELLYALHLDGRKESIDTNENEEDEDEEITQSGVHLRGIQIYTFPSSFLLSTSAPPIWGLHAFSLPSAANPTTAATILYLSLETSSLSSTLLHTFLSPRQCSRAQCFLAEYVLADQTNALMDEWELPQRLRDDIRGLTLEELRGWVERLEGEGGVLEAPVLIAKLREFAAEEVERRRPVIWTEGWV